MLNHKFCQAHVCGDIESPASPSPSTSKREAAGIGRSVDQPAAPIPLITNANAGGLTFEVNPNPSSANLYIRIREVLESLFTVGFSACLATAGREQEGTRVWGLNAQVPC
jgi:hypothetical protein